MATFVLVHGAVVGGWCWTWVAPELRAAGHEVSTPTLTGLGERVHLASPEVNLDMHIQDIVNVLFYEDLTGVILVGWSYGGMIVAGAADRVPERIAHIVYLDSDVPRDGDTSSPLSNHVKLQALAREYGEGWYVPPERTRAEAYLLGELPDEQKRWILDRFAPHPVVTWTDPIRLTGAAAAIPTTYIRCTIGYDQSDEDTQRQDARIRSEPTWRYRELNKSHAAPFSAPRAVAEMLIDIETKPRTEVRV